MLINKLQVAIASLLVRAARAIAPAGDARHQLDAVMVALGRGGPGAPE